MAGRREVTRWLLSLSTAGLAGPILMRPVEVDAKGPDLPGYGKGLPRPYCAARPTHQARTPGRSRNLRKKASSRYHCNTSSKIVEIISGGLPRRTPFNVYELPQHGGADQFTSAGASCGKSLYEYNTIAGTTKSVLIVCFGDGLVTHIVSRMELITLGSFYASTN
jgi:hypothetical protein